MNIEATSVSRKEQRLAQVPSAVYSLAAQNLFDRRQIEFMPEALVMPALTRRSVFVRLAWEF